MKVVVTPAFLTQLCGKLNGAAGGLDYERGRIARVSVPAMPSYVASSVNATLDRSRSALPNIAAACMAMSEQLERRKNFKPPEAYPTMEPTAALTRDAQRRAEKLAKKIKAGEAGLKDDMRFVDDPELQLQLFIALGEDGFNKYLKQLDQRFELARDLINERTWKERKDKEMAGYFDGHEDWMGNHHMGWVYPKGFMTGLFKGGSAIDATIYAAFGAIHDQFSEERKKMWKDLDMPTNTEAIGMSLEYGFTHPGELAKSLVAWDTFKDGHIGEGIGEVTFSGLLFVGTGGAGNAAKASTAAMTAARAESISLAVMRESVAGARQMAEKAADFKKMAADSKVPSSTPGGVGRNTNFRETRALNQKAATAEARASEYRATAAAAEQAATNAGKAVSSNVRTAVVSGVSSWIDLDVTALRDLRAVLQSIGTAVLQNVQSEHPKTPPRPEVLEQ